jgi:hypothetical protein
MVQVSPMQSKLDEGIGLSEGLGKTMMACVTVEEQPRLFVPVAE